MFIVFQKAGRLCGYVRHVLDILFATSDALFATSDALI